MLNLNKVMICGRLTKDPEIKTTTSGISVTTFSVAVNRKFKSADQNNTADFIDVVAWRQTAEFVCKYFKKGNGIFVSGSLQVRTWTDSNNVNRRVYEVVADEVMFAESKKDNGESTGSEFINTQTEKPAAAPAADFQALIDDDDKLPF